MKLRVSFVLMALLLAGSATIVVRTAPPDDAPVATWNPTTAAAYLDNRMEDWATWTGSARDLDTFCVSCHTSLPYAMARSSLATALGEATVTPLEQRLLDNVVKRTRLWREAEPFYPDQTRGLPKSSESRGTESVLNAFILASRDARQGALSDDGRTAFANMWAMQMRTGDTNGAWAWLNFRLEPWEGLNSPYFGAAIAAMAVGTAPGGYRSDTAIAESVERLRVYLDTQFERQPLYNKTMLLWSAASLPLVMTEAQRAETLAALAAAQHADGGWSTAELGTWARRDESPFDKSSDGVATGLVVLALQGLAPGHAYGAALERGLSWLRTNQNPTTGQWNAVSLNKARDPEVRAGKFMADTATAYAVLALTRAEKP